MKISVITVVYNNVDTIKDTIESVLSQTYKNIEYIIIDGGSTDGTLDVIKEYEDKIDRYISEPDNGLWDAMNKGVSLASGDYIGFLNSDDLFAGEDVLEKIAEKLQDKDLCAVYGYVDIVDKENISKVIRKYRVKWLNRFSLRLGLMPAHPTYYCKKSFFERYGGFFLRDDITPDFELIVRFSQKSGFRAECIPEVLIKMRSGGIGNSSLSYKLGRFRKQAKSCRINGIFSHPLLILLKYFYKILEFR